MDNKRKGKLPEWYGLVIAGVGLALTVLCKELLSVYVAVGVAVVTLIAFWVSHIHYIIIEGNTAIIQYGIVRRKISGYFLKTGYHHDRFVWSLVDDYGKRLLFYPAEERISDDRQPDDDDIDYGVLFGELARPSARFRFTDDETVNSHTGGTPLVDDSFVWPTAVDKETNETNPMLLLADIDLSEIKGLDEYPLPQKGHLCVFYDYKGFPWDNSDNPEGVKIMYFENPTKDAIAPDNAELLLRHNITFDIEMNVPSEDEYEDEHEGYYARYFDEREKRGFVPSETEYNSKMFGFGDFIQGNAKPSKDHILLFQIDSDYQHEDELSLGDAGKLYIYITLDALKAREFDKIQYDLQCG